MGFLIMVDEGKSVARCFSRSLRQNTIDMTQDVKLFLVGLPGPSTSRFCFEVRDIRAT